MNILSIIFLIIGGILLGGSVVHLIDLPQIRKTISRNIAIEYENEQLEKNNKDLQEKSSNLIISKQKLNQEIDQAQSQYNELTARRDEIKNSLDDLSLQQAQAAQKLFESAREVAQASFDQEIEKMSNDLDKEREIVQSIYLELAQDCVTNFQQEIQIKQKELAEISDLLAKEKENVDTAVEAAKRRQEMESKQDFYRLVLSDDDIAEIKRLREVLPFLRDKTALNKVIYKVYYEKPLTDMIGRVIGTGTHTGIYKITNIENQKCYVGQAVDLASRWRQHCKRGVGAEDWTRNKLYPAMYALGVENFTFEVVEECERSKLNEREDYWQEYFHAKDFGYSIK